MELLIVLFNTSAQEKAGQLSWGSSFGLISVISDIYRVLLSIGCGMATF